MEKGVVLKVDGIRKEFSGRTILDDVTFSIQKGEIFGIIGASGSGKSTLLHTFVGFYEPENGEIYVSYDNKLINLANHLKTARSCFGFAPQHPSFYPKLTVRENLEHFGILYGLNEETVEKRIDELLPLTRLEKAGDYFAERLSHGMQKRLGIACALIHNPSILIMDEPTADLDPLMRKEIWKLVKNINASGTTVIIASHLLGEVESMCNRIGMLHDGKMVYIGTFNDMKDKYCPSHEVTVKTESRLYDKIMQRIKKDKTIISITQNDNLQILTTDPEKIVDAIVGHVRDLGDKIEYLHVSPPSLEEIFSIIEGGK